jgi:hypothetical protein
MIDMKPQQEPSTQEVLAGLVERVTSIMTTTGFVFSGSRHEGTAS